jgi:IclR family transcriptional regulator, pca regulon regulatory protein
MTIALGIGTRLPAHCTSMGRVLLAALPEPELEDFLATARLEGYTDRTITDPERLRRTIHTVRDQGWALVDQELEIGLRSIAAPLRVDGRTIAAINVSAAAPRVPLEQLRGRFLPELLKTVDQIATALERQRRPAPPAPTPARPEAVTTV